MGGMAGQGWMSSEDAGKAASYASAMNEVLRLNASAEEYKYQAALLRNNKGIYETQLGLNLSSLKADVDASQKELFYKERQLRVSTNTQILLQQGKVKSLEGAQKERELTGAQQVKNTAIAYAQDVKEQLYNIRKDTTKNVAEMSASFINRGYGSSSTNARTMIYNDLDDREYRSRLKTDYAVLAVDNAQSDYQQTTAVQRENLGTDIENVNLSISGLNKDLNAQISLFRSQAEAIDNKANIQTQIMVYDNLVKNYQDESQARLYDYKAKTSTTLGTQTLLAAQLKLAASNEGGYVKVTDFGM